MFWFVSYYWRLSPSYLHHTRGVHSCSLFSSWIGIEEKKSYEAGLCGSLWRIVIVWWEVEEGGWKLTVDIFFGQIKCGSHCPFFCSMNRVYLYTAPTFPRSQPCTGLWSELDGVRLFRWSQVNQHVFCWLTVGARARFLNLKESPVKLGLPGSTEFGSFWENFGNGHVATPWVVCWPVPRQFSPASVFV